MTRRELLAGLTSSVLAAHVFADMGGTGAGAKEKPSRFLIRELRLATHLLPEMTRFYRDAIGFAVVAESRDAVTLAAGASLLTFERAADGSRPFYHFAFNIPENKIEGARAWLGRRATLLLDWRSGDDVTFFPNWNAHAVYCHDPAGNLVELIARHTLANTAPGEFSLADVLYASEIGLVPPDPAPVFAEIRRHFGLMPYLDSPTFLGDESGLIIVFGQDWKWLPERRVSGIVCPTEIVLRHFGPSRLDLSGLPFALIGQG
jgi:catechol 2,3-dioxygenase-like lactoylglutathione lyase family enzyme